MGRFTCALLLGLMPALAGAQTSGPARTAIDITKADIDAAVKIGMAALVPGQRQRLRPQHQALR